MTYKPSRFETAFITENNGEPQFSTTAAIGDAGAAAAAWDN